MSVSGLIVNISILPKGLQMRNLHRKFRRIHLQLFQLKLNRTNSARVRQAKFTIYQEPPVTRSLRRTQDWNVDSVPRLYQVLINCTNMRGFTRVRNHTSVNIAWRAFPKNPKRKGTRRTVPFWKFSSRKWKKRKRNLELGLKFLPRTESSL